MTKEQKNQIDVMRKDGRSYNYIADILGLSKNTVKSYCQRHKENGIAPAPDCMPSSDNFCRCCGKKLQVIPGRKPRKFCSDECRVTWWNCHLDMVNRKANYDFTCVSCGTQFSAYGNAHRKYCCHECYINHRFKSDVKT